MSNHTTRREGFALPVALLAMMVIGAIVTGGFYAVSPASSMTSSTDLGSQAFRVAEQGLNKALGQWVNADLVGVDSIKTLPTETVREGARDSAAYTLEIRLIRPGMYLVTSEGYVRSGRQSARRRIGSLLRTLAPQLPAPTALAIYGGLQVGGSSDIDGDDASGPGCEPDDAVAGVTAYDSALVHPSNRDHIRGYPPVDQDTTLDPSALGDFGAADLQDLMERATHVYADDQDESGMGPDSILLPDGSYQCDLTVKSNWGDPTDTLGACGRTYPIIHVQGDMRLTTGTGQGILIVDGDLQAAGSFDYYGIVIVRGELTTIGTGNHFEGSVIVQGHGSLESESIMLGSARVQYSRCHVQRAFDGSLRPEILASRSWFDFTAASQGVMTLADRGT